MNDTEPRFYTHDINDGNVDDLQREIDALRERRGRLVGVVDEEDGGIIAYAVTEEYAALIVSALSRPEPELPYTVGINIDPPLRLRRFATEDEAAAFIGTLEGAQDGRYYLDGPEV